MDCGPLTSKWLAGVDLLINDSTAGASSEVLAVIFTLYFFFCQLREIMKVKTWKPPFKLGDHVKDKVGNLYVVTGFVGQGSGEVILAEAIILHHKELELV